MHLDESDSAFCHVAVYHSAHCLRGRGRDAGLSGARFAAMFVQTASLDGAGPRQNSFMSNNLCLISHDLHPYGAQRLALMLTREWTLSHKRHVEIVSCGGGSLSPAARRLAPVTALGEHWRNERRSLRNIMPQLRRAGVNAAFTNTVIAGKYCKDLREAGFATIALIHEMPSLIATEGLLSCLYAAHEFAHCVIYPHAAVANAIDKAFPNLPNWDRVQILPQGIAAVNAYRDSRDLARDSVRKMLGIAADAKLVIAVGTGDRRKGVDLFLDTALAMPASDTPVQFLWVGPLNDADITQWSQGHGGRSVQSVPNTHWLGYQDSTAIFHAAADAFVLCSREDPFPFVVLESLSAGVPVVAFAGSGGGADLVLRGCGINVSEVTGVAMARTLNAYLADDTLRAEQGRRGMAIVDSEYRFDRYAETLLKLADSIADQSQHRPAVGAPE